LWKYFYYRNWQTRQIRSLFFLWKASLSAHHLLNFKSMWPAVSQGINSVVHYMSECPEIYLIYILSENSYFICSIWPNSSYTCSTISYPSHKKNTGILANMEPFFSCISIGVLCKLFLYITINGKVQFTYQSGKTGYTVWCSTESTENYMNEYSVIIKAEMPDREVLCISETTKSAICRV
jgi:hypothetical protein